MLRRLAGATLFLFLAWSGTAQALGLGDIRLQSALNEPFRAEIDLLSVTDEELSGLQVQLAPAETFQRYGIDRPPFLANFRFEVRPQPGERGVVVVTSAQPVTEPFVTFLAEAIWPRGRLLREYTVLLNPPTFAADEPAPAPVRAPATPPLRSGDPGSIRRDPEPAGAAPDLAGGETYRVQRNDTLWEIAERVRPSGSGLTMNQVMVSLYENNGAAFDGNINRLRAGAMLRVPSEDAMYRINRSEAVAEVRRQNQAWRGGEAAGSLRLVPPEDEAAAAAAPANGTSDRAAGSAAAGDARAERIRELEAEVAERERLLTVKDEELARLRQQLAAREEAAAAAAVADIEETAERAPGVDLEAEGEAATDEIFAESGPIAPAGEETVGEVETDEALAAGGEPEAEEQRPTTRTPAVVTTPREPERGFMETLTGLLGSVWTYVGLGAVVAALALLAFMRRRRGEAVEESTGTWQALTDEFEDEEEREATERLRALAREDDSILVVENEETPVGRGGSRGGAGAAAAAAGAASEEWPDTEASGSYSFEDTFSSETATNLDQSDPLAEADFHMAYGLYDQAADLMRSAIRAEPERTDLKAKLAEVYFVWGNKDAFVDAAENLHDALGGEKSADWDRTVIMGQQIVPDHPLFAGASAGAGGEVDLSFEEESGVGTLDVDFGADAEDDESGALDLTFGDDDESGEIDLQGTSDDLDFLLDETGERSGTNEMVLDPEELTETEVADESTGEPATIETRWQEEDTEESPILDTPYEEDIRETPTIETPVGSLEAGGSEITQETRTIETPEPGYDETTELPTAFAEDERWRSEQTAEIDLDDLDLDLDTLAATGENSATILQLRGGEGAPEDELTGRTGETQVLDEDDATMLAPGAAGADEPIGDEDATRLASSPDYTFDESEAQPEDEKTAVTEATRRMPALGGDVDLNLDGLTAPVEEGDPGDLETPRDDDTVEQPASRDDTVRFSAEVFDDEELDSILDLDVGEDLADDDQAPTETGLQEGVEGRTQTEVGTKLDLARAYVDMGDPEGARSILQEVLEEGDEGQRQEANRLLDALPD